MKWQAVFVGLLVGAAAAAQPLDRVAHYAKALYVVSYDDQYEDLYKRDHTDALAYVHRARKAELRKNLTTVYRKFGSNKPEGAGAAYLMAMHGIDVERNVDRLLEIKLDDLGTETVEALPEALTDIALRWHSRKAVRGMIGVRLDGMPAELQSDQELRLFSSDPDLMTSVLLRNPSLRHRFLTECMYAGYDFRFDARARSVAQNRMSNARGKELEFYRAIVKGLALRRS